MKLTNPIKNAAGLVKTAYYNRKAEQSNQDADTLREYNQGNYKTKKFVPDLNPKGSAFQTKANAESIISDAKRKALNKIKQ